MRKLVVLSVLLLSVGLVFAGGQGQSAAPAASGEAAPAAVAAWEPTRNVEWVVTSSPGGGSSIYTQTIIDIITQEGLVDANIIINYQTDGGGAVGRRGVSRSNSMGHTLLTFNNGDLQPLVQNEGGKLDDLTPIAIMATDGQILLVPRDSKYRTHTDFINALKSGERIIMTGSRGDDQEVHRAIVSEVGGNLEYLNNDSTAVALTQILGGNADVVIAKPAASFELVSSGELRPLIAATKNRFNAPFDAPTFKELGYDIELTVFRGLAGPANMPAEAVAYWSDIMRQVSESPLWKQNYLDKFLLNGYYLPADEAVGYMRDFEVLYTR